MRRILLGLCVLFFLNAHGQEIPLPEKMPQDHPRVLTTPEGKKETWKLIKKEAWAQDVFNKLKERTEVYTRRTESQPEARRHLPRQFAIPEHEGRPLRTVDLNWKM